MSISGIGVSPQLTEAFSKAIDSKNIRFLKISIRDESLVHDLSVNVSGSLEDDLLILQQDDVLDDDIPAYVLTRLDEPPTEWLVIFYVPDSAKVRDKMLYASTRNTLTKSLGSSVFTDSIFANSKADLTPEAYAKHRKHMAAPKPLSAQEQEMADIRAAEREAGGTSYEGSRARQNVPGTRAGFNWAPDVEEAVHELGAGDGSRLVVINIDTSETLVLGSAQDVDITQLGSSLPLTEPCYALFAWPHTYTSPPIREIVFIYSCPSSSSIKHKMLYSSGARGAFATAKTILAADISSSVLADRKIETSDPKELDESYLVVELGLGNGASGDSGTGTPNDENKKPFARPKGPGRR